MTSNQCILLVRQNYHRYYTCFYIYNNNINWNSWDYYIFKYFMKYFAKTIHVITKSGIILKLKNKTNNIYIIAIYDVVNYWIDFRTKLLFNWTSWILHFNHFIKLNVNARYLFKYSTLIHTMNILIANIFAMHFTVFYIKPFERCHLTKVSKVRYHLLSSKKPFSIILHKFTRNYKSNLYVHCYTIRHTLYRYFTLFCTFCVNWVF